MQIALSHSFQLLYSIPLCEEALFYLPVPYFSVDRHLCFFQFGALPNTAVRILVFVSLCTCVNVSLSNVPKSDIAGSQGIRLFSFIHTAPFFQNCTRLQSFQQSKWAHSPTSSLSRPSMMCVCGPEMQRTAELTPSSSSHLQMHKIETQGGQVSRLLRSKVTERNTNRRPLS